MIELRANDWYTVTGRGQMVSVNLRDVPGCPDRINNESQIPIRIGQHIRITDHGVYEVMGVEYAQALTYPPFIKPDVSLRLRASPTYISTTLDDAKRDAEQALYTLVMNVAAAVTQNEYTHMPDSGPDSMTRLMCRNVVDCFVSIIDLKPKEK